MDTITKKNESIAEAKFEAVIAETAKIVSQCNNIVITDKTTLSMAEQALSKANDVLKLSEERRKEANKPAQDYIDKVNEIVKSRITTPLKDCIAYGKQKLKEWNEQEALRAKESEVENKAKLGFLNAIISQLNDKVKLCDTVEACDNLIASINNKWPSDDKFGIYLNEAVLAKDNFIETLLNKKQAIVLPISDDLFSTEDEKNQLEEERETIIASIQEKSETAIIIGKSKTRKTYKYEIVSEADMPKELMSPDSKKINEFMKSLKGDITKEGMVINGIKFYLDETPVLK